jgi:metal-responsive CopG/Arc/MetJ family transcriptional regulator
MRARINVSVDPEILAKCDDLAKKSGFTRSSFLTKIINDEWDRVTRKPEQLHLMPAPVSEKNGTTN